MPSISLLSSLQRSQPHESARSYRASGETPFCQAHAHEAGIVTAKRVLDQVFGTYNDKHMRN